MYNNDLRKGVRRHRGTPPIENWAIVVDVNGGSSMPLDESIYRERGYQPPFEELPWNDEVKKNEC